MKTYLARVVDSELDALMPELPAIALEGAKGVGKTATGSRRAQTVVQLDEPAQQALARADVGQLLGRPAPILLDETTARAVREQVPRDVARVRRLAVIRPYGLDMPLEVSELLPPESQYPLLTDEHLAHCEAALDAFLAGRWSEAFELLHRTPTEDTVTDFLTVYIAQHNRTAPPDWDGVITLSSK